jgi:hypothetical protein
MDRTAATFKSVGVSRYLEAQRRMQRYPPVITWVVRVAYSFSVGGAY